jgi:hypothetical protein
MKSEIFGLFGSQSTFSTMSSSLKISQFEYHLSFGFDHVAFRRINLQYLDLMSINLNQKGSFIIPCSLLHVNISLLTQI